MCEPHMQILWLSWECASQPTSYWESHWPRTPLPLWNLSLISVETTLSSWWLQGGSSGRPTDDRRRTSLMNEFGSCTSQWSCWIFFTLHGSVGSHMLVWGTYSRLLCLLHSGSHLLHSLRLSQYVSRSFSIVCPTEISSSEIFAHLTLSESFNNSFQAFQGKKGHSTVV